MRKTLQELRYKCGRHNTDSAIPDSLKSLEAMDQPRYHGLYLWVGIMGKTNQYRPTIRDLVTACSSRKAEMDLDYARAFSPALGLK